MTAGKEVLHKADAPAPSPGSGRGCCRLTMRQGNNILFLSLT